MAFRMSIDLKNELSNRVTQLMAGTIGTGGTASLTIRVGTQPTDIGSDGTGGTLCVISDIGWGSSTAGTASFATAGGYLGTAVTSGTAGWARLECINDYGTCRIDGDIGTAAGNIFTINVNNFSSGGVFTLVAADIYTV